MSAPRAHDITRVSDVHGEVWIRVVEPISERASNIFINRYGERRHFDHLDAPLSVDGHIIRPGVLDVSS